MCEKVRVIFQQFFCAFQVLKMAPWHRTWAVGQIAKQITGAIERASEENRNLRGFGTDANREGDRQAAALLEDIREDGSDSNHENEFVQMFKRGISQPKRWQAFWDERKKDFN